MTAMDHECAIHLEQGEHSWIWYDKGTKKWRFDTDDGLRGPEIMFCPFCGEKLP